MINEKGFSLAETILALAVITLIFLTLIPFSFKAIQQIHMKKSMAYVAEVGYRGALAYRYWNETAGSEQIENEQYDWRATSQEVCVQYDWQTERREKCFAAQ